MPQREDIEDSTIACELQGARHIVKQWRHAVASDLIRYTPLA